MPLQRRRDRVRHRPLVVRVGSTLRDALDERGEARLAQHVARVERAVHGLPVVEAAVQAPEPDARDRAHRRQLEPVARVPNRVARQLGEGARPPTLEQVEPAGDRTGNRHRVRTDQERVVAEPVAHGRDVGGRGRAPRAEVAVQLPVPDDREQVTAVAAQVRRDDAEREVRGDDGVDRVATACELGGAGGGGEVVRGRQPRTREPVGDAGRHACSAPAAPSARGRPGPRRRPARSRPSPGPRRAA